MSAPPPPVIELRDVCCTCVEYGAVQGIDLRVERGKLHGFVGSGHRLLARLVTLLEPPARGEILHLGVPTSGLSLEERASHRARHFGFVFSSPFLLPNLSVVENVAMPLFKVLQSTPAEARDRAQSTLEFVGLAGRENDAIGELSRPEQHAAALARALVHEPDVLLMEQDGACGDIDLLRQACARWGTAVIVTATAAAHVPGVDRLVELDGGVLKPAASGLALEVSLP